ncbi:MAG: hypothetical protein Q8S13_05915 [Dehalococcoidia bacterium]|nr:hypothetical protein [Dehalococcoidia bacterium]
MSDVPHDSPITGPHECCWHHDMLHAADVACCLCCHCGASRWPADGAAILSVERDEQGHVVSVTRQRRGAARHT